MDALDNVTANGRDRKDNDVEFPWSEKEVAIPKALEALVPDHLCSLISVGYA